MYLIIGSTGMVGSEICRLLSGAGEPTRALVRSSSDPAKVIDMKAALKTFPLKLRTVEEYAKGVMG